MSCKHASTVPNKQYIICNLGLFGGKPSPSVCQGCKSYEGPSRGLGDTVKKVIQTASLGLVKPCTPCQKRRELLNKLAPYAPK